MQTLSCSRISRSISTLVAVLFLGLPASAQNVTEPATPAAPGQGGEGRAARALEAARENPLELRAFLVRMPKGADLHVHLSGAVYAESFIRAAAEDNLCVDSASLSFAKPVSMTTGQPAKPVCGDGRVPAANAFSDQELYDALVDAFSMRSFQPSAGISGHDHFFDTFAKFGGTDRRHTGEWVDEVTARAAAQNEQYMELMQTPKSPKAGALSQELGWQEDFTKFRNELLEHGIKADVTSASTEIDQIEAVRKQKGHCGEPGESPACKVEVRYLYQVLRGLPKGFVFAQTLVAFETASADPRFVGLNYVMPEDGYTSMADYALHMRMLAFFHNLYPKVHISLHAGELAPGLVPPDGLCCHIRLAVEQAAAERIGHGVDVMYEGSPDTLLKEMAAKHVMVEINLSSNDLILGVSGKDHPFPIYRRYGVPVALSTDDEGVSRIDLTREYVRAVQTYGLHYADLKKLVRTGLEHGFLPGESLWRSPDNFTIVAAACRGYLPGKEKRSTTCDSFLKSSEKARQQWELERRFLEFEASPDGNSRARGGSY
jgi:adenosine deaminase